MLSPNDGSRIILLPEDKELIRLAGWTEKEYRDFVRFSRSRSRIKPGTPVAALAPAAAAGAASFNPFVAIALLVVGVALSVAASYLLRPKLKTGSHAALLALTRTQSTVKTLFPALGTRPRPASTHYKMWSRSAASSRWSTPAARP